MIKATDIPRNTTGLQTYQRERIDKNLHDQRLENLLKDWEEIENRRQEDPIANY
jgi:hypothetical protein